MVIENFSINIIAIVPKIMSILSTYQILIIPYFIQVNKFGHN